MSFSMRFVILFVLTVIVSFTVTAIFRKLAGHFGWVDHPGPKKIHTRPIATLGGIAIFVSYWMMYLIGIPPVNQIADIGPIFISSFVILLTGIIDDRQELKPWQKMLGILLAANIYYFFTEVRFDHLTIAYLGRIEFSEIGYLAMILWIAGITNAVNLMDGLDGLAAGSSIISLTTMGLVSYVFSISTNVPIVAMTFLLVAALIGFLPHNFYPAKIFLGDTGSLFIGFMIATLSLNGLKHATFISLLIPVAILGVPLTDTLASIIRRLLNRQAISQKDRGHLHHRLLKLGFNHRQTVLVIYALGIIFSLTAMLYPLSSFWGSIILTLGLLFGMILFIASFNLIGKEENSLKRFLQKIIGSPDKKD